MSLATLARVVGGRTSALVRPSPATPLVATARAHRSRMSLTSRAESSSRLMAVRMYADDPNGPRADRFMPPIDHKAYLDMRNKQRTGMTHDDPQWLGDWKEHRYPTMPAQHKNPYIYDDRQERRNFGDPLQENDDLYGVFSPDIIVQPALYTHYTPWYAAKSLLIALAMIAASAVGISLVARSVRKKPHVDRTLPYDNGRAARGMNPGDSWERHDDVGAKV